MTGRAVDPAGTLRAGGDPVRHGRRLVAALAVTQTVGYGTLYYAFAVLLAPMAADLHASTARVTGALTASVLAGAVLAVPVGRWQDRRGGRGLMTSGSALATVLVAAWSQVQTVGQLYVVLVGIGCAGAMVLYPAAFAVLVTRFDGAGRARALLVVTVVAGFASSIFLPLTALLVERSGWRSALLVLATAHGLITVPLHALTVRRPARPAAGRRAAGDRRRDARVRVALRDARFWILTVAFVAHGAAVSTMAVHLIGYLTSRGHPGTFAATVAGLLGVLSVTGRIVLTGAGRRVRTSTVVPVTVTRAVAPLAAAALQAHTGYLPVLLAVATCCAAAALSMPVGATSTVPEPGPDRVAGPGPARM